MRYTDPEHRDGFQEIEGRAASRLRPADLGECRQPTKGIPTTPATWLRSVGLGSGIMMMGLMMTGLIDDDRTYPMSQSTSHDLGPLPVVHPREDNSHYAYRAMFAAWCDICTKFDLTFAEQFDVLARILRFLCGQCLHADRKRRQEPAVTASHGEPEALTE